MKKLLLLIVAIMVFGVAANAQRKVMDGDWTSSDNPSRFTFKEYGAGRFYIVFTNDVNTHRGAGYWVSPTQAKLVQTMTLGGCSVDMYLIFTELTPDKMEVKYEFLEAKCGWRKGFTGKAVITRAEGS